MKNHRSQPIFRLRCSQLIVAVCLLPKVICVSEVKQSERADCETYSNRSAKQIRVPQYLLRVSSTTICELSCDLETWPRVASPLTNHETATIFLQAALSLPTISKLASFSKYHRVLNDAQTVRTLVDLTLAPYRVHAWLPRTTASWSAICAQDAKIVMLFATFWQGVHARKKTSYSKGQISTLTARPKSTLTSFWFVRFVKWLMLFPLCHHLFCCPGVPPIKNSCGQLCKIICGRCKMIRTSNKLN